MNDLILRVYYNNAWNDLDIDSNIPLRLNISAVENTDIGQIYGVGSQTFVLPGTRNNKAFFKGANRAGAVDIPAIYQSVNAQVLYNGEMLLEGEMMLQEVITNEDGDNEYKVIVEDQVVALKDALDGVLIKDANFDSQNHTLNQGAIIDSWIGTLASGDIIYPVVDYGLDEPSDYPTLPRVQVNGTNNTTAGTIDSSAYPLTLKQFLPAISARATIDAIFDQAGFRYTSSLIETTTSGSAFNDLFILPKAKETLGIVVPEDSTVDFEATATTTNNQLSASVGTQVETVNYNNEISDPSNAYNDTTFTYLVANAGNYVFDAQIGFNNPANAGADARVKLIVNKNGSNVNEVELNLADDDPSLNSLSVTYGDDFVATDTVKIQVSLEQTAGAGSLDTMIVTPTSNNYFRTSTSPIPYNNAPVSMSLQFDPTLLSFDVLKGILTKFNAVAVPEPNQAKTIRIENYEDFIAQGRNIDWSDKYDNAKRIGITHPVTEQSKELKIADLDDEDRFSKLAKDNAPGYTYGTTRVISDSNIPNGTKEVKTTFAPTIMGTIIQFGSVDSDGNPTFNLTTGSNFVVPHLYKFENTFSMASLYS